MRGMSLGRAFAVPPLNSTVRRLGVKLRLHRLSRIHYFAVLGVLALLLVAVGPRSCGAMTSGITIA